MKREDLSRQNTNKVDRAEDHHLTALPSLVETVEYQPVTGGRPRRSPHSIHPDRIDRTGQASINIIVCLIISLLMGVIGFTLGTRMQNIAVSRLDYTELNEAYNALSAKFDGKLDKNKLIQGAARGLVNAAGDQYTEYMTAQEYGDLEVDLSGEVNGIGVEIGLNGDAVLSVISALDDSPAKKAGVMAGDLIEKVNGEDVTGWTTSQVANKIRGKSGTKVKLTVLRNREEKQFEIERTKINNPSVKWEIKDGIGYMRISTFGNDTGDLATKAAKEFQQAKVKGVILDLRSNTGGYVDAAQDVTSLWLKKGTVITEERSGSKTLATIKATGNNILGNLPTVVLIDGATASASEITAGALRDNLGAKLVGTKSYGKGLVQEVVNLNNGDVLKVTVAKWYTPKGENINKEGLKPDQEVNMTAEQYNSGNDTQRAKAEQLLKR